MSKEKPEIGDVWECNGQKMIVIGVSGYFHPLCIKKDGKEFEESWLFLDTVLSFFIDTMRKKNNNKKY